MFALVCSFRAIFLCMWFLAFSMCTTTASNPTIVGKKSRSIEPIKGCWAFDRNPKSGTSTLANILHRWEKRHNVEEGNFPWSQWVSPDRRETFLAQDHTILKGQFLEALRGVGGGGDCTWFTVFRHPIPRLISAFYYCKYKRPDDVICGGRVLDVTRVDFTTFAKHWSNFGMRNFIMAFVSPEEVLASPAVQAVDPDFPGWYKLGLYANELYGNETANNAAHRLDAHDAGMYKFLQPTMELLDNEYAAVGILEDFDNTLRLFDRALKIPDLSWVLMYEEVGQRNEGVASVESSKNGTLLEAWTDPTIYNFVWLDMLLYNHALALQKKQLVEYGLA